MFVILGLWLEEEEEEADKGRQEVVDGVVKRSESAAGRRWRCRELRKILLKRLILKSMNRVIIYEMSDAECIVERVFPLETGLKRWCGWIERGLNSGFCGRKLEHPSHPFCRLTGSPFWYTSRVEKCVEEPRIERESTSSTKNADDDKSKTKDHPASPPTIADISS